MIGEHIESEAKFLTPGRLLPSVKAYMESLGFRVEDQETEEQQDIYWDTPQRTLFKTGAALRLRYVGGKCVAAVKRAGSSDKGVISRPEVEWPVDDLAGAVLRRRRTWSLPLPSEARLPASVDQTTLVRVLTLYTVRQKSIVSNTEGFRAELVFDNVLFRAKQRQRRHKELELELKSGKPGEIEYLADSLRRRFDLTPSVTSKYSLGMDLVG